MDVHISEPVFALRAVDDFGSDDKIKGTGKSMSSAGNSRMKN